MVLLALMVAAGTLIETVSGSHLQAAKWTYSHPLFLILLALIFVNILVSALQRWPFTVKHIPFLATHLGLLMIIGGLFIKNSLGVQGSLDVLEGQKNEWLTLPHTFALCFDSFNSDKKELIPIDTFAKRDYNCRQFPYLRCKVIGYTPHVAFKQGTRSIEMVPETPPMRLEDRRPGIVLAIEEGLRTQTVALPYNREGEVHKRSVFGGKYRIAFQPKLLRLPYLVELKEARQMSYPQSEKTYSFECDLLFSDDMGNPKEACTLSMNHVFETSEGWRFYLAGMGKSEEGLPKSVHLVVSRDPAKLILTYPGIFLLIIGSAALFWSKKSTTQ